MAKDKEVERALREANSVLNGQDPGPSPGMQWPLKVALFLGAMLVLWTTCAGGP